MLVGIMGCIKARPPVQAPSSVDVAVATHLQAERTAALPAELEAVLRDSLAERRLNLRRVGLAEDEAEGGSTAQRLRWLATQTGGAPVLLLIELQTRRYATMGGRFRWIVEVALTTSAQSAPQEAETVRFSVPVHLSHVHQAETDAVRAALPMVKRRLGAALDAHLLGARSP
jgi:hypothetical protein